MKPDIVQVERGVYSVLVEGRAYEVRIEGEQGFWRGQKFSAAPPQIENGHARATEGAAKLSATMPGKVVRVLVRIGDEVSAGQGIVVVEAMKMQNEMKAPRAGVVKTLRAENGGTVAAGDLIALIE